MSELFGRRPRACASPCARTPFLVLFATLLALGGCAGAADGGDAGEGADSGAAPGAEAGGAASRIITLGPADGHDLPPTDLERVTAGDPAPDFTAMSGAGEPITLSDYRGQKNVVLFFYRGHW